MSACNVRVNTAEYDAFGFFVCSWFSLVNPEAYMQFLENHNRYIAIDTHLNNSFLWLRVCQPDTSWHNYFHWHVLKHFHLFHSVCSCLQQLCIVACSTLKHLCGQPKMQDKNWKKRFLRQNTSKVFQHIPLQPCRTTLRLRLNIYLFICFCLFFPPFQHNYLCDYKN